MKSSSENIRAFKYLICKEGYDFLKESVNTDNYGIVPKEGYKSILYVLWRKKALSEEDFFDLIEENYYINSDYRHMYNQIEKYVLANFSIDTFKFNFSFLQKIMYNIYKDEINKLYKIHKDIRIDEAIMCTLDKLILKFPNCQLHPEIIFLLIKNNIDLTPYLPKIADHQLDELGFNLFLIIKLYYDMSELITVKNELQMKMKKFIDYFKTLSKFHKINLDKEYSSKTPQMELT
jgi:hypothetical protein